MVSKLNRLGIAAIAYVFCHSLAFGGPIIGGGGLTNPASTITFGEVDIAPNDPVTTQFAPLGLSSLSGFFLGGPNSSGIAVPNGAKPDIRNFTVDETLFQPNMQILFSGPVTDFFTSWQSDPILFTMTSFLNGVQVETFQPNGANQSGYGFSNSLFDEIRITGNGALILDTFQFNPSAVPEPGTWALLGVTGAAFSIYYARRKRRAAA